MKIFKEFKGGAGYISLEMIHDRLERKGNVSELMVALCDRHSEAFEEDTEEENDLFVIREDNFGSGYYIFDGEDNMRDHEFLINLFGRIKKV